MIIIDTWKNTTDLQLDGEIWKDVKGYEGIYQVSNLGRVKSLDRVTSDNRHIKGLIRKQSLSKDSYLRVNLSKNNKYIVMSVHRLVAEAFIPNPHNYPEINHKSRITTNNTVTNLEWCTREYNCSYEDRGMRAGISSGKPVLLTNINTNQKYVSLSSKGASKLLNTTQSLISMVAKGNSTRHKTVKNHTARYLPKDFEITTKEMNFTDKQKKHLLDNSVGEITV